MTKEALMTLCGERLHHIRTQRGFTQSELAELVGVEQNHISHIESGRRMMSLTLLREIAQALRSLMKPYPLKQRTWFVSWQNSRIRYKQASKRLSVPALRSLRSYHNILIHST